ncbi:hypothetical protein [Paenibacillus qinlingensis]|uniref:hypothetical protein n=1 Tax=Paenibacillus qinlingensis TaxID=1837343 RepID=UPI001565B1DD|nr:hypothetical protein [Paenibacillus qinlingensis]NQX61825.1 hypothetical protein [Paenibacillus qinlingensis]
MKITVVDSIMGSGKTSWALQHVNEAPADQKFIYITPYLDEVQRVIATVTNRRFSEPNNANSEGRKLRSLKELIATERNIVATHSLFQSADDELIELLTDAGYTLLLDEVMDVIDRAPISASDIRTLIDSGRIEVRDTRVYWISDDYTDGRFDDIKLLAKAGNLFVHRDNFFLWAFPPRVFQAFDEVIVMTYLFAAQVQRYYYDLHGMVYEYKSVTRRKDGDYELVEYDRRQEKREEVMCLIDVYDGPLNEYGDTYYALSSKRLRNYDADTLGRIQRNTYNYFRNICKAKGEEILWTTLKDCQNDLRGRGYAKSFVPVNIRATNEFKDRWALAYIFNQFLSPIERVFFEDRGISVDQDLLAVSDLLQWIWRSRIRVGQPIRLYLPSSRMRSLLIAWSKYEI